MMLDDDRWVIIDHLIANELHNYKLHWLLDDLPFEQQDNLILLSLDGMKYKVQVGMLKGNGSFSLVRANPNSTRGWQSRYYGHKEPAISVMLEENQKNVTFWSFFGFENDTLELEEQLLNITTQGWSSTIDLSALSSGEDLSHNTV
jgi:hypothetical protein